MIWVWTRVRIKYLIQKSKGVRSAEPLTYCFPSSIRAFSHPFVTTEYALNNLNRSRYLRASKGYSIITSKISEYGKRSPMCCKWESSESSLVKLSPKAWKIQLRILFILPCFDFHIITRVVERSVTFSIPNKTRCQS